MATKIDIGGELNPRTVEGIVADASTIIDRTAEKRQDEINSEVSESLEGKQGVIPDLETIRSGAASGSTAIQPTQIEDVVRHVDTGALEPLLDPSDYATTDQLNQLGQYNDVPEWLRAITDNDGKILYGVKTDGKFYFGDGCPPQVVEYIQNKINELSLDEYEDIVAFLGDLIDGDSLATLLNAKLDKGGLDPNALETAKLVGDQAYIQVITDSEDKVIEGITSDGKKVINLPIDTPAALLKDTDSPEFIDVKTDTEGRIVSCRGKDGALQENVGIKTPNLVSKSASLENADVQAANIDAANITTLNTSDSSKEDITNTILTKEKEQEFSLLFGQTTGQVESFIFFSDPHYFSNSGGGYDNCVLRSGALSYLHRMRDYFINTPTNFILCGGDWLEDHKQSVAIKDLGWIDGFMNKLFLNKYYPILGNHDNNYQGELDNTEDKTANDGTIPNEVVANLWFRKYHKLYYSFKGTSSTFYIFNSGIDWNASMDSYRWEQVDWFGEKLLTNEDEHIIIGIHIVTNSGMVFGENITALANNITLVANAFNSRTSITLNGKTYNFANVTGTIHCALCGHVHYDGIAIVNNIPVMCIDDAMGGNFDLVLVDYGDNVLKTIRVGTGTDRIMNLV